MRACVRAAAGGAVAVLEELASLDFFRIRNLTAFFIGEWRRRAERGAEEQPAG